MRIVTVETVRVMIERGIEIEEIDQGEAIEMTEGRHDAMPDETISTDRPEETGTCSKVAWIEVSAVALEGPREVIELIETNLQCRWVVGIGRRAQVPLRRRKSPHQI